MQKDAYNFPLWCFFYSDEKHHEVSQNDCPLKILFYFDNFIFKLFTGISPQKIVSIISIYNIYNCTNRTCLLFIYEIILFLKMSSKLRTCKYTKITNTSLGAIYKTSNDTQENNNLCNCLKIIISDSHTPIIEIMASTNLI